MHTIKRTIFYFASGTVIWLWIDFISELFVSLPSRLLVFLLNFVYWLGISSSYNATIFGNIMLYSRTFLNGSGFQLISKWFYHHWPRNSCLTTWKDSLRHFKIFSILQDTNLSNILYQYRCKVFHIFFYFSVSWFNDVDI